MITPLLRIAMVLAVSAFGPVVVLADEDLLPPPSQPEAPVVTEEAVEAAPPVEVVAEIEPGVAAVPTVSEEEAILFRLVGGGEIVGKLVKETPGKLYIDIGPSILELSRDAVQEQIPLSKLRDPQAVSGVGAGTFDPLTGSVIFRSREDGGKMLSQRDVLENVKRSVVLVSNPGGLGTGWMVDTNGRIVTNHHVVGNESFQTVTIFVKKGGQWEKKRIENCTVEAYSSLLDIAIVQLDMAKVESEGITLYPMTIAQPRALEAGDNVFAVGNPGMGGFVLDHTISEGIVSSLARNFSDIIYLQTTAAVNPGNSGGPLVNERGEVVGLITLKAMFQEGVAFALPVDYILHFLSNSRAFAVSETNRNKGFRYHPPR